MASEATPRVGAYLTCAVAVLAMAGCGDEDAAPLSPVGGSVDDEYASVREAFPDASLAAAVVAALRDSGEDPVDPGNLAMLDAGEMGIQSLEGLELLTNLRVLNLSANTISDLRPLSTLVRLQMLDLSHNQVVGLQPLVELDSLLSLDLTANHVMETAPLLELRSLESVYLADNDLDQASLDEHIPELRERGVEVSYPVSADPGPGSSTGAPTTEMLGYWEDVQIPSVNCVAVDAEGRVYAGAYSESEGDTLPALLVSGDGGRSWQSVIEEMLPGSRGPIDVLHVDPEHPEIVLAHTRWGFVRSVDGGRTWAEIRGLYNLGAGRYVPIIRDDIVGSVHGVVYALTLNGPELRVSSDYGATWGRARSSARAVAVDGAGGLYVSTGSSVLFSEDMGASVREIPFAGGSVISMATDGQEGQVLYAGTREAVYRSRNGGVDWELVRGPVTGTWILTRVEADPRRADVVILMAASEPQSAAEPGLSVGERINRVYADLEPLVLLSTDAGDTWTHVDLPGIARDVAFDPTGSGWIYVATSEGVSRFRP